MRAQPDTLPLLFDVQAMIVMYREESLLTLRVEDSDSIGFSGWVRDSRADEISSVVLRLVDWDDYDAAPTGPALTAQMVVCDLIWRTKFAKKNSRRTVLGHADGNADACGIRGYTTTRRRRTED